MPNFQNVEMSISTVSAYQNKKFPPKPLKLWSSIVTSFVKSHISVDIGAKMTVVSANLARIAAVT